MHDFYMGQTYSSPFNYARKGQQAQFNPFIDLIELPLSFSEFDSKEGLQFRSLELGHSYLALEGNRMMLKDLVRRIYKGIYRFITDPDTSQLKIPTFGNAPGLQALNYELNLIFEVFEPVEEIITLARTVSSFKENVDPFRLRKYGIELPESLEAEGIETQGLRALKNNFGVRAAKLYNLLMSVSDYNVNAIMSIAHVAMSERYSSIILFGSDVLEDGETEELKKAREENFRNDWYTKVLLTKEGVEKIKHYYQTPPHYPEDRLTAILNKLKEEKDGPWDQEQRELAKTLVELGMKTTNINKFDHLGKIFTVGTVYDNLKEQSSEGAIKQDHYRIDAEALSFILRANKVIEQRDTYKCFSYVPSEYVVEILLTKLREADLLDLKLAKELQRPPLEPSDGEKRLRATVFMDRNRTFVPGEYFDYYKPLYLWEDIRGQFHDGVADSELTVPLEFKEDKKAQELFKLLRKGTELDDQLVGM